MTNHLLLLDASGFIHTAFHAANPTYRKDGLPTWAVIGFMSMVWGLLGRAHADAPTHGAAVFDYGGKTFRHDLYPLYKANRNQARREELLPQLPYIRHAAKALGFETIEEEGFEADDALATLARRASEMGWRTTIASGDKDLLQLVRDGWVEVVDPIPRKARGEDAPTRKRYMEADVKAKFGCIPALVPDAQALSGDAVDNIPGIDGIGGKGAGSLIQSFGSLEALLDAANKSGKVVGTPAIRKALRKHRDDALLFKRLATLRTDVPIDIPMTQLQLHPVERGHLKEMLRVLEADHKFDVMFTTDPSVTVKLPHVDAPLLWWSKANKKGEKNSYVDQPQDGFFKRRLVRGGSWVAAKIWRESETDFVTNKPTGFDVVRCEVDGKPRNAAQQWDALQRFPITKADFDYLVANSTWHKQHKPNSSEANPSRAIDWLVEELE